MVECHVSGKVFVKKLETLLTSTLDQYTYVETDYKQRGCPKSRIAPFAIVYFGKKYYLTVAKKQTL